MNELTVLEHNNIRVLTTEQLAEAYGCGSHNITKNYNANRERFVEGKHFFVLEGDDLRLFRLQETNSDLQISPKARCLYLWTKRGAARHCKMLGTDRAWDVFDELEENYFNPKMSMDEIVLHNAQRIVEQSKALRAANARLDRLDSRLLEVESRQMTIDRHHYTIIGYANLTGVRGVGRDSAAALGRKASALSRKQGYHIGREYDAKYGVVNTYHADILQEVFRGCP